MYAPEAYLRKGALKIHLFPIPTAGRMPFVLDALACQGKSGYVLGPFLWLQPVQQNTTAWSFPVAPTCPAKYDCLVLCCDFNMSSKIRLLGPLLWLQHVQQNRTAWSFAVTSTCPAKYDCLVCDFNMSSKTWLLGPLMWLQHVQQSMTARCFAMNSACPVKYNNNNWNF